MSIFWDLHSSSGRYASSSASRVAAAASAAAAESKAARAVSRANELAGRAEKALMICEALWLIIREKHGLDDELLEKAVRAVDLQDGRLDGKVRRDIKECQICGKKVGRNRIKCIWCGAILTGNVFD